MVCLLLATADQAEAERRADAWWPMTRQQQITEALKLLDPPRDKREEWRKLVEETFNWQQTIFQNNAYELKWADSKQGKRR